MKSGSIIAAVNSKIWEGGGDRFFSPRVCREGLRKSIEVRTLLGLCHISNHVFCERNRNTLSSVTLFSIIFIQLLVCLRCFWCAIDLEVVWTHSKHTRTEGVKFVGLRGTCALLRRRGRIRDRPAPAVLLLPYDNRPPSPRSCTVKMPDGAHLLPTGESI